MNDLTVFQNPEFGEIRTIEENGDVLFCGTDVAKALGYINPRDAVGRRCKGVVKRDAYTNRRQTVFTTPEVSLTVNLFYHEGDLQTRNFWIRG